jgi:hypothetical protein
LIALPTPLFQKIEKRAFAKKQRLGRPWFRNDEVRALLEVALAAIEAYGLSEQEPQRERAASRGRRRARPSRTTAPRTDESGGAEVEQ